SERLGHALPEDLEYVVMSCLAKDPADRPTSAVHLAELLLACDCPPWTAEDARRWWEVYGEAARNVVATKETPDTADASQFQVVLSDSRT
ncbi:MAG: hypothetical protein JRG94_04690, partial [Deltaproteobacteria bacterium]|nr:hypothetical protein [Deltaproteobacteria bacterium]